MAAGHRAATARRLTIPKRATMYSTFIADPPRLASTASRCRSGERMSQPVRPRGFTLIEMLVVLSVIGLLLSLVAPSYLHHVDHAQELALKHNLKSVRGSIDQFRADRGR